RWSDSPRCGGFAASGVRLLCGRIRLGAAASPRPACDSSGLLVDFVFDGREAAEQSDELGAEVLAFTPRRAPDLGGLALGRADEVERRRLAVRAAPARTNRGRLAAVITPAGQPVEPLPLLRHLAFEPADLVGERPQGLLRE